MSRVQEEEPSAAPGMRRKTPQQSVEAFPALIYLPLTKALLPGHRELYKHTRGNKKCLQNPPCSALFCPTYKVSQHRSDTFNRKINKNKESPRFVHEPFLLVATLARHVTPTDVISGTNSHSHVAV